MNTTTEPMAFDLRRNPHGRLVLRLADGTDPIPDGPFDVIVLSGSVAAVPPALLALLRNGGRLMGIVGNEPAMRATGNREPLR